MRNKVFQFVFWYIFRPLFLPKTPHTIDLEDHFRWQIAVVRFAARWLNASTRFLVIMGDSNGRALNEHEDLREPEAITINLSVSATTFFEWLHYLRMTAKGQILVGLLKELNAQVVWNIGGNNALQARMARGLEAARDLAAVFPDSFSINIPPVPDKLLASIFHKDCPKFVRIVNEWIDDAWAGRVIDAHTAFLAWREVADGSAWLIVARDTIHYTREADQRVRMELIRRAIGEIE